MAISTYGATLKWGATSSAIAKVVPIKDFPNLLGEPNLLETTTLDDDMQTNILGIKQSSLMTFTCNYDKTTYASCEDDAGTDLYYELSFSDGSKFTWQGQHTLGVSGKGVDEVVEFTINIANSTVPVFSAS